MRWVFNSDDASHTLPCRISLYHTFVAKADSIDGSRDARIVGFGMPSLTTFAALVFVLGQCHAIMEFWMRRKLRACRNKAYEATVLSRGKPAEWWTPYVEEWEEPPIEKAIKNSQKQKLYIRLASPLIRIFILKGEWAKTQCAPSIASIAPCLY